jgi:hypothetical protein
MAEVSAATMNDLLVRIRADWQAWVSAVSGSAEERQLMKCCYVGFTTLDTILSTPGQPAPTAWTPTLGMVGLLKGQIGALEDANADLTASKNRLAAALREARAVIRRLQAELNDESFLLPAAELEDADG